MAQPSSISQSSHMMLCMPESQQFAMLAAVLIPVAWVLPVACA